MKIYYFYQHLSDHHISVQKELNTDAETQLEFIWIDFTRIDVVNRAEAWQKEIYQHTHLYLNEFHVKDILNLEHPCSFDTMDDYNLLIFRKLITPDDDIGTGEQAFEQHEQMFGLATTPVSFIITPQVLITVREQGNMALKNYISRIELNFIRSSQEQNKSRKLPVSPFDLSLRLLNSMVDGYLDLRVPLTRRVGFWQQELLQGHRRFKKWDQLLQESMSFQQVEDLCEEQIDTLQEFRDEIIDNYPHSKGKKKPERLDILLVRINDLISHVERIQKHIVRLRASIQATIDLHFSAIANQTNENMRILAIITTIFAPLTLLTGIYGMNFEFIPGLKSPTGFWVMLIVMVITTILLIYYFYRRHLVGLGEKSVIDLLAQQYKDQHVNLFWLLDNKPIKRSVKKTVEKVEKLTKLK
ncbi:magnesium transporter CorA family protein [Acinetobacter sp.]|uniref:magnesium transporter CorA family protein n=1 Tax=Acinetobacter sp. TaxID=472 RepID=UPI00388FEFE4